MTKWVPFVTGGIFSAIVAIACYAASGVSLGLFFGPILLLTFLAPPLALSERGVPRRILVCGGLFFGVVLIWVIVGQLSLMQIIECGATVAAYILALSGIAQLLERVRLGPIFASAATVVLAFAWLTWPVWLSPWFDGPHAQRIVNILVPAHPLMAMNAVLFERFNFWDRYPITYQQLTTLNQDVLYKLPGTVVAMVMVHLLIGMLGFVVGGESRVTTDGESNVR